MKPNGLEARGRVLEPAPSIATNISPIFDTGPGIVSGLALLHGAHLNNFRNETRYVDGLIPMDRPFTLLCVVRESGVHITGDGVTVIDWSGQSDPLSLPAEWTMPDSQTLFLGSQEGILRFEAVELIPLRP